MRYIPKILKNKMIFSLEKPIYGSFYGIWDKWLKQAKQQKLKLVIKFKEGTVFYNSVDEFLKGTKRFKRFYKNPDEPMIFYGKDLLPELKNQIEKKQKEKEMETPFLPFETKVKLVEAWKQALSK